MRGLCHKCLTSDQDLFNDKGHYICQDCYHKIYKQSAENQEIAESQPTLQDLKKKLERK